MCWQCKELDRVIEHYRALEVRVSDRQSRAGLAMLVEKIEANKIILHCFGPGEFDQGYVQGLEHLPAALVDHASPIRARPVRRWWLRRRLGSKGMAT